MRVLQTVDERERVNGDYLYSVHLHFPISDRLLWRHNSQKKINRLEFVSRLSRVEFEGAQNFWRTRKSLRIERRTSRLPGGAQYQKHGFSDVSFLSPMVGLGQVFRSMKRNCAYAKSSALLRILPCPRMASTQPRLLKFSTCTKIIKSYLTGPLLLLRHSQTSKNIAVRN